MSSTRVARRGLHARPYYAGSEVNAVGPLCGHGDEDLWRADVLPSGALYRRLGFVECEPFGGYSPSRNSTFMTLELR